MVQPTLIVMAAGIGTRYGGLKQIDPVGPNGELVLDYSVYDALRAGFGKVVFLLRPELEAAFRERVGRSVEARADTVYVFQELDDVPPGFRIPAERKKPWGTGHAVLACRPYVQGPAAVINADDFYGADAFGLLASHLAGAEDLDGLGDYAMVGYRLSSTLSDFGRVARGLCRVSAEGDLIEIREITCIERAPRGARYSEDGHEWHLLTGDEIVSLNMWGFTLSIFKELAARFPSFLRRNEARIVSAEYFLPEVVGELLREQRAHVRVMKTQAAWFGVTYRDDMPRARAAVRQLIGAGVYPENLWSGVPARAGLSE